MQGSAVTQLVKCLTNKTPSFVFGSQSLSETITLR